MKILVVFLFIVIVCVLSQEDQFWNTANVIEEENPVETKNNEKLNSFDFEPAVAIPKVDDIGIPDDTPKEPISFFNYPQQDHWYYEMAIGVFVILYVLQYFRGKSENDRMAKAWLHRFVDLFRDQFSSVKEGDAPVIYKDGHSDFRFWATGRINCNGLYAYISMKKRFDLITEIYETWFGSTADLLTIEVPLAKMEPFVFAIAPKKYQEEHIDLTNYVVTSAEHELLKPLVIYTDSPELVKGLLTEEVVAVLKSRFFVSLHFSDESRFYSTKCLKFVFKLTSDVEKMAELMELTFHMIDAVANIRLKDRNANLLMREKVRLSFTQKANKEKEEEEARKRKKEKLEKQEEKKKKK